VQYRGLCTIEENKIAHSMYFFILRKKTDLLLRSRGILVREIFNCDVCSIIY